MGCAVRWWLIICPQILYYYVITILVHTDVHLGCKARALNGLASHFRVVCAAMAAGEWIPVLLHEQQAAAARAFGPANTWCASHLIYWHYCILQLKGYAPPHLAHLCWHGGAHGEFLLNEIMHAPRLC
jgi:hypothetical protein